MDEQAADLDSVQSRSARFGKLPARVRPEATVEIVETSPPQSTPYAAGTEEQRQALLAGG